MQPFKVGEKIRFKGQDEWKTVIAASGDDVIVSYDHEGPVKFPASSFTRRARKVASSNRVSLICTVLPETLSKIKSLAKDRDKFPGQIVDQMTEGTKG